MHILSSRSSHINSGDSVCITLIQWAMAITELITHTLVLCLPFPLFLIPASWVFSSPLLSFLPIDVLLSHCYGLTTAYLLFSACHITPSSYCCSAFVTLLFPSLQKPWNAYSLGARDTQTAMISLFRRGDPTEQALQWVRWELSWRSSTGILGGQQAALGAGTREGFRQEMRGWESRWGAQKGKQDGLQKHCCCFSAP